jgi:hypothetical protein
VVIIGTATLSFSPTDNFGNALARSVVPRFGGVVYNDCGEPLAAISVSGMTRRLTDERLPALGGIVREVAAELTVALGGVVPEAKSS